MYYMSSFVPFPYPDLYIHMRFVWYNRTKNPSLLSLAGVAILWGSCGGLSIPCGPVLEAHLYPIQFYDAS